MGVEQVHFIKAYHHPIPFTQLPIRLKKGIAYNKQSMNGITIVNVKFLIFPVWYNVIAHMILNQKKIWMHLTESKF